MYFETIEMSSFLRLFKLLNQKDLVYESLNKVVQNDCNNLVKKAYDIKGNSVILLKGEK